MQINTEYTTTQNQTNIKADNSNIQNLNNKQSASQQISGTVQNAEVKNLSRSDISIKLENGTEVNGKILNPDAIKIGLVGDFNIEQNELGENIIRLVSGSRESLQSSVIDEALNSLGMKLNAENKNIVSLLINNSYPVTKENFMLLNRCLKLMGSENQKGALFFMNNQIKPSLSLADQVAGYENQAIKISNQISDLTENILKFTDNQNLEKAFEIIAKNSESGGNLNNLSSELKNFQNLKSDLINELDKDIYSQNQLQDNTEIQQDIKDILNQNTLNNKVTDFVNQNKDVLLNVVKDLVSSNSFEKFSDELNNIKQNLIFSNKEGELDLFSDKEIFKNILSELFKDNQPILDKILEFGNSKQHLKNNIAKEFALDIENLDSDKFKENLSNLSEKLSELKPVIQNEQNTAILSQATKSFENINNNLNFMANMQNTIFLQFPIMMNGENKTAEVYVFNNKAKKHKSDGQSSALVSIDTGYLGHFEVYIQKNNQNVNCQFRLENEDVKNLVIQNIELLNNYLKNYNFDLGNVSYKNITEAFSITDDEPINQNSEKIKDFSFDMRT